VKAYVAQRRRGAEEGRKKVKVKGGCRAEAQGRGGKRLKENEVGTAVVEAAIAVHRELGNGLLESVYEAALAIELTERGLAVERQVPVEVAYKGRSLDQGFRADLIVEHLVILELKSVEVISAIHKKQIQTYLKLTGLRLGYLLNFGAALMKHGIFRCVNNLAEGE